MYFGSLFDDGNTRDEQGEYGEHRVNVKILRIKDNLGECYLYRDIYIEYGNKVIQIDHILLTRAAIFVIETKAISGKINGTIADKNWTSNIYGKKTNFLNPLLQNKIHVDALRYVLGDGFNYHSIIVFTEKNKPDYLPSNVINIKELQDYLLTYDNDHKLSPAEMKYLKESLDELQQSRAELKQKHKELLKYHKTI